MAKVRFLQSAVLIGQHQVLNFNDELEISDKLAESLEKQGIVDILEEEKAPKTAKTTRKKPSKAAEKVVEDDE